MTRSSVREYVEAIRERYAGVDRRVRGKDSGRGYQSDKVSP